MQLRDRSLIVLEAPDGTIGMPSFQVTSGGEPRPELRPLLEELRGFDGWTAWAWLTSPSDLLAGDAPEKAAATDLARALRATARFAASARQQSRPPS